MVSMPNMVTVSCIGTRCFGRLAASLESGVRRQLSPDADLCGSGLILSITAEPGRKLDRYNVAVGASSLSAWAWRSRRHFWSPILYAAILVCRQGIYHSVLFISGCADRLRAFAMTSNELLAWTRMFPAGPISDKRGSRFGCVWTTQV